MAAWYVGGWGVHRHGWERLMPRVLRHWPGWRLVATLAAVVLAAAGCTRATGGAAQLDTTGLLSGCPGQVLTTREHADLGSLISPVNPGNLPRDTDPEVTGSQSVEMLADDYDSGDQGQARDALTSNHFVDAYQWTWSGGVDTDDGRFTEVVAIYRFADPVGACRFADWEADYLSMTPTSGSPIPGARGSAKSDEGVLRTFAAATRSRYVIEVDSFTPKRVGDRSDPVALLLTGAYQSL
jgi:hypothetical protein